MIKAWYKDQRIYFRYNLKQQNLSNAAHYRNYKEIVKWFSNADRG